MKKKEKHTGNFTLHIKVSEEVKDKLQKQTKTTGRGATVHGYAKWLLENALDEQRAEDISAQTGGQSEYFFTNPLNTD